MYKLFKIWFDMSFIYKCPVGDEDAKEQLEEVEIIKKSPDVISLENRYIRQIKKTTPYEMSSQGPLLFFFFPVITETDALWGPCRQKAGPGLLGDLSFPTNPEDELFSNTSSINGIK